MACYSWLMRRGRALLLAGLTVGCSYPEFAFQSDAAVETSVLVEDSAVIDSAIVDSFTPDTMIEPMDTTAPVDTSVAMEASVDSAPEAAVDTGPPECVSNIECPCGQVCVSSKCVAATDCTKDNHFCPAGKTCTCVGGRYQISGAGVAAGSGVVEAMPVKLSDNGADLILRNYDIRDTATGANAMKLRPANCTSAWHYRNVVLQCITTNDSTGGAIKLSRRDDPLLCRPPTPPDLFIDQVTVGMAGSQYNGFSDLEYKTVRLRKVVSNTGLLFDTWGPGEIGEMIVQESPNLRAELQGKINKVTVMSSPGFQWWTSSPTETTRATWPRIQIFYDKASCPVGRALIKNPTNGVDENCAT
jgi:hypothetical protein